MCEGSIAGPNGRTGHLARSHAMGTLGTVFKWTAGTVVILGAVGATAGAILYPKIQKQMMNASKAGELAQIVEIRPDRLVRTVSAPGEHEPRRKVSISARVSIAVSIATRACALVAFAVAITLVGAEILAGPAVLELASILDTEVAQIRALSARARPKHAREEQSVDGPTVQNSSHPRGSHWAADSTGLPEKSLHRHQPVSDLSRPVRPCAGSGLGLNARARRRRRAADTRRRPRAPPLGGRACSRRARAPVRCSAR